MMVTWTKRYRRCLGGINQSVLMLAVVLAASGCAPVGPDYVEPVLEAPVHWRNASSDERPADDERLVLWWRVFDDRTLDDLIIRAVDGNLDVRQAISRVEASRLQRRQAGSVLSPTVVGEGSVGKSGSRSSDDGAVTSEWYAIDLGASWELDVFGGLRRSLEAATADYQVTIEDMRDVTVTLLAEVAVAYIDLRAYQQRLLVARSEAVTRQESLALLESAKAVGLYDQLPLDQARANLAAVQAGIPTLENGIETSLNRLAILLGQPAGELHHELLEIMPIPQATAAIMVGIPAEVLRQRPDIRRAERELAGQTARVGVAEAELYPSFSLSGSIGLEAVSMNDLFSSPTRQWSIGPSFSWPIFDAGYIRTAVLIRTEEQRQAALAYRSAVLTAVEETENALAAYVAERQRLERLGQGAAAARSARVLTEQQYRAGLLEYSDVLDAQRSVLSLEDQLAQSRATVSANLVHIYRTFGGGWQTFDQPPYEHDLLSQQELTNATKQ